MPSQTQLQALNPADRAKVDQFLQDVREGRDNPVLFAEKILGLQLHQGQKEWLFHTMHNKKNILVPANRWGKTYITAVKHIWKLYYKIGLNAEINVMRRAKYRTLNLAPNSEQARIEAEYIKKILRSEQVFWYQNKWQTNICKIGDFLPRDGVVESPNFVFTFNNGSQHIARTAGDDRGGAIQGGAFHYISFDECCRSYRLEEEVEPDLLPRLIDTDGDLDLLSTPDKDSPSLQYYYELCEMGKERIDGWFTQEGYLRENEFIPEKSHQRAEENITDLEVKKQVLEGKFIFSGGRMFNGSSIKGLWHEELIWEKLPVTLLSLPEVFGKPFNGHKVVWAWDFARSESGDATVGYAIDYQTLPYEIVCGVRIQGIPITTQIRDIKTLVSYYNARLGIDSNSLGGQIILDLLAGSHPEAFDFKGTTKGEMLLFLKKALEDKRLIGPKPTIQNTLYYLRRELGAYKEDDKKLKTDCVMALGIGVYLIESRPPARLRPIKMFRKI